MTINYGDLTIEQLRKQRPDLLQAVVQDAELASAKAKLQEELDKVKGEMQATASALAKTQTEYESQVEALTQELAETKTQLEEASEDRDKVIAAAMKERDATIAELKASLEGRNVADAVREACEGYEHAKALQTVLTYGFVVEEEGGETWHAGPKTVVEVEEVLPKAKAYVEMLAVQFGGQSQGDKTRNQARDSFKGQARTEEAPKGNASSEPETEDDVRPALTEEELADVEYVLSA